MSELNFELTTDLSVIESFNLEANFDEMETALEKMMAPYGSMVITEDEIPAAKKDMANINRIVKRIDEMRKTVKKAYLEPYERFEARCKQISGIGTGAYDNIKGQVRAFEESAKQEKIASIREYFNSVATEYDIVEYMRWERCYNPKWENKTFAIPNIYQEIDSIASGYKSGIEAIRNLRSEHEPELLLLFRETGDVTACINRNAQLMQIAEAERVRREEEEARRKAAEEERKRREAIEAAERQRREAAEAEERERRAAAMRQKLGVEQPVVEETPVQPVKPQEMSIAFRCYGTREQLMALSGFMKSNGIRFERA